MEDCTGMCLVAELVITCASLFQDKYLQLELLRTSSEESDPGKMQQLMKLFAVSRTEW